MGSLRIVTQLDKGSAPAQGQLDLHVRAVGLNFRNVLSMLGVYPGYSGPPGADCAAHVPLCGAGSANLSAGDAAFGFAYAALASITRSDSRLFAAID